MNKKLIILTALMLVTSYQGLVVLDASAGPGDFTTMWVINLPRATYFIGESVTFTVVAFASSDPSILLPDQMAKITIRNSSMAQVYEAWVTTNVNGSAPVTWESGLDAYAGNYTIILDDLSGKKVIAEFMLLYNEETFWQTKVDLLEREIQSQYSYLNYIFSFQKYQERRLNRAIKQLEITMFAMFMVLFLALWTWFPELAKRARSGKGIYDQIGRGLAAAGITSEPRIYLDHEEVSQVSVPPDKAAPRFNVEFYCEICDPQHQNKMILQQYEDHVFMHDKHFLRGSFWRAWRREKARKSEKKSDEPEKLPEPTYAPVIEYKEHWNHSKKKKTLMLRAKALKKLHANKKIDSKTLRIQLDKVWAELEELKKSSPKKPEGVLKVSNAPKPQKTRTLQTRTLISGIPEKPIESDSEPCTECEALGGTELSEKGRTRLEKAVQNTDRPIPRTKIDELFDELSREKVN